MGARQAWEWRLHGPPCSCHLPPTCTPSPTCAVLYPCRHTLAGPTKPLGVIVFCPKWPMIVATHGGQSRPLVWLRSVPASGQSSSSKKRYSRPTPPSFPVTFGALASWAPPRPCFSPIFGPPWVLIVAKSIMFQEGTYIGSIDSPRGCPHCPSRLLLSHSSTHHNCYN